MAAGRVFKPLKIDEAVAEWAAQQSAETVAAVERASVEASKARGPHEWDLADFDRSRLRWVMEWLPQAPAGPRLAVLKRLHTVLRDPRLTRPLLSLLSAQDLQPIEHSLVLSLLEENHDAREAQLATELGVSARLETLRREAEKWLRFAAEREAMLGALFARPDDLELRMVTADWLSGFGDPLGELMSLQLSGAGDAIAPRVAQLMERYGPVWCADLFAPEPVREVTYEQGAPVSIQVPRPIRWVPACATLRAVTMLSGEYQWLRTSPWKRVRVVRPLPAFRMTEFDQRFEEISRFDEFTLYESHGSTGAHSKVMSYRDGRLVFFTTREPVPGLWKNIAVRLPGRRVKLVVPTTSGFVEPPGVEVEFMPSHQLYELMFAEARRLEQSPV